MDNEHAHDSADHSADTFSQRRAMLAGLGGLAAGAFMARSAQAGPLNPPPGPIASTPGPEPRIAINSTNTPGDLNARFRITQPGSYYLTGNLSAPLTQTLIEIAADNVTLDLNGFTVKKGNAGDHGIATDTFRNGIVIRNGFVEGWTGDGIRVLSSFLGAETVIEDVVSRGNGGYGIRVSGVGIIRRCAAQENANGFGLDGGQIQHSHAQRNDVRGFDLSGRVNAVSCSAFNNLEDGFFGFICTFYNCFASNNSGNGFNVGSSLVTNCQASGNGQNGIDTGRESLVFTNHCTANGSADIRVDDECRVAGNVCRTLTGSNDPGIRVNGSGNHIVDNSCTGGDRGIIVNGTGNILERNRCSATGSNYSIAAGNRYGPIVDIRSGGTAAVSGSSAPGTMTSTDPTANFSY